MDKCFLFSLIDQEIFDEMSKRYNFNWRSSPSLEFETVKSLPVVGIDSDALGSLERYMRETHAQTSVNPDSSFNLATTNLNVDTSFQFLSEVFNKYFRLRSDRYRYSVYGNLFFLACNQNGLKDSFQFVYPSLITEEPNSNAGSILINQKAIYYQLQQNVFSKLSSGNVNRLLKQREQNALSEFEATNSYIDDCFDACPSLFVLRINLGYLNSSVEQSQSISLQRLKGDLNNLVKNFLTHEQFKKIVGYVIKLDYSPAKNYFAQLVVLFDNRTPQTKKYWARLITDYWTLQIPQGMGAFFNWNETTECYGLGIITKEDTKGKMQLKHHVVGYMIQSSLYISVKEHSENAIWLKGTRPKSRLQDYPSNFFYGLNEKDALVHLATIQRLYKEIGYHLNADLHYVNSLTPPLDGLAILFDLLMKIEALMVAILYDQRPAFATVYTDGTYLFTMHPLAKRIWDLGDLDDLLEKLRESIYKAQHSYSVFVVLFYHALEDYFATDSALNKGSTNLSIYENKHINSISRFLSILRYRLQNSEARKILTARKSRATIKYQKACDQFDLLVRNYKYLAIFSLNLWPEVNSKHDLSTANGDDEKKLFTHHKSYSAMLSKFFKIGQNHPCLSPMVGYFIKWEFTQQRGRYAHVVLLMNATKIADDSEQLNAIQKYWAEKITEGGGKSEPTYISSDLNVFPTQVYHLNHKDSKRCKAFKEAVLGYMIPSLVYYKDPRILMHNLTFGSELAKKGRTTKNINRSSVNLWPIPRLPKIIVVKEQSVIMGPFQQIEVEQSLPDENTLGIEKSEHASPTHAISDEIIPNANLSLMPEIINFEDAQEVGQSTVIIENTKL